MAAPLSFNQRIKALDKSTHTPSESRITRSAHNSKEIPEWHDQLSAAANAISPSVFDAETLRHRAQLQSNVKTTPESPAAWSAYLRLLNSERKRHATPETAANMHATLVQLYDRATAIIPLIRVNRHSEIYLDIWLDLASLRAEDAEDAYLARETFKYMKRECIGLAYPKFWYAWADLEEQLGNHDKAEEHRRKGRTRESGGTPASTAKPPNPVTTRRPLRPPRRANDIQKENQPTDFIPDKNLNDSSTEMKTPVISTATRTGFVLSSAERNQRSPALSNWTPVMRESPSPIVKATPEHSLIRPTDAGMQDSLSKYYAHRRETPAPVPSTGTSQATETKATEMAPSQLARQTPPVRTEVRNTDGNNFSSSIPQRTQPVRDGHVPNTRTGTLSSSFRRQTPASRDPPRRDVYDVLGTRSRRQEGHNREQAPRSASFQDSSRDEQVSAQKRWNSVRQSSSAVKSSPPSSSFAVRRSPEASSPEVLRSAQTRGEHKPTPSLFSPGELPALVNEKVPSSHAIVEKRQGYDSSQREEATSSRKEHLHKPSGSGERQEGFSSSVKVEKRERQGESDNMEQSRYSKRKPGTPVPVSRNVQTGKSSTQKREAEEPSPLPRTTPPHQFSRQLDSSSSATPATAERERHRQRLQSPRQPSFLTELGPERYVTVNGRPYVILELVGRGGSSRVYKVLNYDMRIMALKRVKVQMTSCYMVTLNSYANEIALLKKLHGSPNIVQLYDAEVKTETGLINLIMEYGDIDLAKRLSTTDRKTKINGNFRRLYWNQMLEAVHTIHEARIVHGDLKPANFLIVAGTLKLIDFGIAKAIQTEDTTKIVRDTQQGTPNYMSPEALMAEGDESFDDDNDGDLSEGRSHKSQYRVGRASDIWSLGCILYQMVYGRTPFAHIKNVLTKLSCIQDANHEISYRSVDEPLVVDVLKGCLQRDPRKRMSIPQLLNHPYLNSGQERAVSERPPSDLTSQVAGDSRLLVRSVCEAAERCGYCVTTFSGEKIAMRNGDRVYERLIDTVARKVTLPQISMGQWDNAHCHGRDRSFGAKNQLLTPTTSAITNQASRTGLTGSKTRTGTNNGNGNRTGTKTGERYWN